MKELLRKNKVKIINVAFVMLIALVFIFWLFHVTPDMNNILAGPDEAMRYTIPSFIHEHGRLPTGYETAIHGNWSYAFYPQVLGAIVSAGFIDVASLFTHDPFWLVRAARLTSVIFGVIAAIFVRRSVFLLFNNHKYKTTIGNFAMVLFALLPQVSFLSSYVNNDIIALAGISIIFYTCLYAYKRQINMMIAIWFAVGSIFAILGYLNSYGFVMVGFVYIIIRLIQQYRKTKDKNNLIKYISIILGVPTLICTPFFIRNTILYSGDILGVNTFRAAYASWLDKTGDVLQFPYQHGLSRLIFNTRWVLETVKSFVMGYFGGWSKGVVTMQYLCYYLIAFIGAIGFVGRFLGSRMSANKRLLLGFILLGSLVTMALSVYYTLTVDYQPQGRYVIYLAIPIILGVTTGIVYLVERIIKPPYVRYVLVCIGLFYVILHLTVVYKTLF